MNDEYNRIFDQISRLSEHDKKLAKHIFTWMTYALRPLTLEEVECAFTVEWETFCLNPGSSLLIPEHLLMVCGNLVMYEEKQFWQRSSVLRFVHVSVKDYLRSKGHEMQTSPTMELSNLFTGEIEAHNILAKTSITYLYFVGLVLVETWGNGRNDRSGNSTNSLIICCLNLVAHHGIVWEGLFPSLYDNRHVFTELPYAFLSWARHAHQLKALASPLDSLARYLHVFMSSESFGVYLQSALLTQFHLAENYTPLRLLTEIAKGIAVLSGWSLIQCKYLFILFKVTNRSR